MRLLVVLVLVVAAVRKIPQETQNELHDKFMLWRWRVFRKYRD